MDVFNYCFARSRSKAVKGYRLMMYYMSMWEILMNQFEYTGLPDSLPAEWIEGIMITNGTVGIGEKNGVLYAAAGSYSGQINGYIPENYIAAVPAVGNIEGDAEGTAAFNISGKPSETIVVGWNNTAHSPELELIDIAEALCEGRTSEDINVIFSRLLRIPIARDSKDKAAIEAAINAILEGKIEAVSSALKLDEILDGDRDLQFLDLVDVKDVDKLQYLNQYMDNMLKRFMRRHGFSLNITNKLAQQTNAEMHGADDYSMIYPLIQLKYRRRMIGDLNRIFGEKYDFHATVDFCELLKNNYDTVVNYIPDELNEREVVGENGESEVSDNETDNKNTADN